MEKFHWNSTENRLFRNFILHRLYFFAVSFHIFISFGVLRLKQRNKSHIYSWDVTDLNKKQLSVCLRENYIFLWKRFENDIKANT
jgi:hypothetical protein